MKTLASVVLLIACLAAHGQAIFFGQNVTPSAPSGLVYKQFAYLPQQGSSSVASITTAPNITVSAGDLVVVGCYRVNSFTIASNLSISAVTYVPNTGLDIKVGFFEMLASGSANFTCTPSTSSGFMAMIALDYSGWNSNTLATQQLVSSWATPCSTPAFTTSGKTLNIIFADMRNFTARSFVSASIAGNAATERANSAGTLGAASSISAADYITTTSVTSAPASITISADVACQVVAITY